MNATCKGKWVKSNRDWLNEMKLLSILKATLIRNSAACRLATITIINQVRHLLIITIFINVWHLTIKIDENNQIGINRMSNYEYRLQMKVQLIQQKNLLSDLTRIIIRTQNCKVKCFTSPWKESGNRSRLGYTTQIQRSRVLRRSLRDPWREVCTLILRTRWWWEFGN